jgi:hypothetical protein
MFLKEQ